MGENSQNLPESSTFRHMRLRDNLTDRAHCGGLLEWNKDDISKADDISVEVDDFKEANEAFENQVEVCIDDKVKTEPDEFED